MIRRLGEAVAGVVAVYALAHILIMASEFWAAGEPLRVIVSLIGHYPVETFQLTFAPAGWSGNGYIGVTPEYAKQILAAYAIATTLVYGFGREMGAFR